MKILESRDVVFDESRTWNQDATETEQRMGELGSQNHYDDGELGSQSSDQITDANFDDIPVRGTRPIGEIYQRADVALLEHAIFKEVETIESQKEAIKRS